MNVRQGAGTGALLLYAGGASRLAEHPALSHEDDMAVRELLLELTSQAIRVTSLAKFRDDSQVIGRNLPLLDSVEAL